MGASVGQVIDYLVDKLTNGLTGTDPYGAPITVPALSVIDPNVEVADARTETSDSPWVTIGVAGPNQDTTISVTSEYLVLGRQRIEESYTIPCEVLVYGDEDAQKPTRDAAVALFDGIVRVIWADPTLGGVLHQGKIAHVSQSTLTQPQPEKGNGSVASIEFTVDVANAYIP